MSFPPYRRVFIPEMAGTARKSTGLPPGARGVIQAVAGGSSNINRTEYTIPTFTISNSAPTEVNTANMVFTIPEWNVLHRSYQSIKSCIFQEQPDPTEWQFQIYGNMNDGWSGGRAVMELAVVTFPEGVTSIDAMIGLSMCPGAICTICQSQVPPFPIPGPTEAFTFTETEREYRKPRPYAYNTIRDVSELKIHCTLVVKKIPGERNDDIPRVVSKLLFDDTFSDVTIICGDSSFPAHKAILAGRSPVFHAMFISTMTETTGNRVDLSIFSLAAVKGMLEYMYNDKTDLSEADPGEWLRMADMYELGGLKSDAAMAISESLNVQNAAEAFQLSCLYNLEVLKTTVIEFIKTNGIGRAVAAHPTFSEFVRTNPAGAVELFSAVLN